MLEGTCHILQQVHIGEFRAGELEHEGERKACRIALDLLIQSRGGYPVKPRQIDSQHHSPAQSPNLKSQSVISSLGSGHGGRRSRPYAFTEQGVAMLSSVLRSETAVRANVEIMRAFVRLRRASLLSAEIMKLVEDLSNRVDSHDQVIGDIVESIRQLAVLPSRERSRPIGFTADLEADSST